MTITDAAAPVENLAHSVSFQGWEKTAPLNPGIKQMPNDFNSRNGLPNL
jgi:hypothetical protein